MGTINLALFSDSHQTSTWVVPKTYTASQLIYAVQHAKSHPEDCYRVTGYDGCTMTATEYVAWFRKMLQHKINRELPARGKKDCADFYFTMKRLAYLVNGRFIVHEVETRHLPLKVRAKLAHRFHRPEDF